MRTLRSTPHSLFCYFPDKAGFFLRFASLLKGIWARRAAKASLIKTGFQYYDYSLLPLHPESWPESMAKPTVLSRLFGLEGVALWNVGAKIATVLSQVPSKFFESSFGGLCELVENNQPFQMSRRFFTVLIAVAVFAVLFASFIVFIKEPFVNWWTKASLIWPTEATWGVAIWLVTTTVAGGVAEQTKILLLWPRIRWGPLLDLMGLEALLSLLFLAPKLSFFAILLTLAPLSGSFLWNCHRVFNISKGYFPPKNCFWPHGAILLAKVTLLFCAVLKLLYLGLR
jgi:O-antigen/teichoic acid export membrane protein